MRRILVRLAGGDGDEAALAAAMALAGPLDARIQGVFVRPRRASVILQASPVQALAAALGAEKVAALDPEDDAREARAKARFLAACSGDWRALTGRRALAEQAALADILVETAVWRDPDVESDTLFHVLVDCQRPVLAPHPAKPLDLGLIALSWHEDLSSVRALASATPLLQAAGRIVVLHEAAAAGAAGLDLVRDHLALHGLEARFEPLDLGDRPAEAVAARAEAMGAGMLAMGGYEHSHLQEELLGGFTQDMLARRPCALLLRH